MREWEEVLISCLLNKPKLLSEIKDKLKPEYFEYEDLKNVYQAMIETPDYTTIILANKLKCKPYDLMSYEQIVLIPSKLQVYGCGKLIVESYKSRKTQEILKLEDTSQIPQLLKEIQELDFEEEKEVDVSEEFLKNAEDVYAGRPDLRIIATGFQNIDEIIGGVKNGELVIIGARPSCGKTTIAMNIAYNIAKEKKKVLFFSIEMPTIDLHDRLVKSITDISIYRDCDFEKVIRTSKAIQERLPLKIIDKAGIKIEDLVYKSKLEKEKNGVDVVFIDHLGILSTNQHFKNRYEQITHISCQLKILAKELDCPVISLCQLSRGVENRDIKAPNMADLRDSGSIEQDADLVCFLHNPEYYLRQREPDNKNSKEYDEWHLAMQELQGKAQFVIAKNRRGRTGKAKLYTKLDVCKFIDRFE